MIAIILPSLRFRIWLWGAPVLGREFHWLKKQYKRMEASQDFKTFVLGMTPLGAPVDGHAGLLATRAFLEDLRVAYQPRLWRRRSWRVFRPILMLDQIDGELPRIISEARRGRKRRDSKQVKQDPLLVIAAPKLGHQYPSVGSPLPRQVHASVPLPPPKANRPALALGCIGGFAILMVAVVLASFLAAASYLRSIPGVTVVARKTAACAFSHGPADGQTMVIPWNGECVGYSDNSSFVFKNPPAVDAGNAQEQLQDERMQYDEEQIFQQNIDANNDQIPGRPVVGLVYFAGLTVARGDDYDPGQAEELEGLMIAQKVALGATSGPLLKVVVANGGSEMQDAASVSKLLVSLFAADRDLLGVVGLDRSTEAVKQAINMFNTHEIPMVATTLSADGIGDDDPYYFQLPPANYQEAHLILQYIQNVVPLYFRQPHQTYNSDGKSQPTKILIYWPSPDPTDLYITTLMADLKQEAPQFSSMPTPTITRNSGSWLCGASTVDIYAGRQDWPPGNPNDTFGQFLLTIAADCLGNEPFVIADDAVTRFIVDPAQLTQQELGALAVSYVSQGIAILRTGNDCLSAQKAAQLTGVTATTKEFCEQYAAIVSDLSRLPAQQGQRVTLQWTGERVGLAYDAAELFLKAEINYEDSADEPVTRPSVPDEFEASSYSGVTGTVDFGISHIGMNSPTGMPLAIVRIQLSSPIATPNCAYSYSAQGVQQFDLVPTPETCPYGFG